MEQSVFINENSWLCYLCNSRAELLKIGREIDKDKDKLGLADLC